MANRISKQRPKNTLTAWDLQTLVHASYAVHRSWLQKLYNNLQNGIECGMNKGDIITIKNINSKLSDIILLKETALERYINVTGLERVQSSQELIPEYLGVYAAHDIFVTTTAKLPKLFKTVYDDLRSGKIKTDFLPRDAIIKTKTPKGEKYSIKKDINVIKSFASLCGIKLRKNFSSLEEAPSSKSAKFQSASQTVRDAWGDEWTTTYSRMPRGNNDR